MDALRNLLMSRLHLDAATAEQVIDELGKQISLVSLSHNALALLVALGTYLVHRHFKQKRLKQALLVEVSTTSRNYAAVFTPAERQWYLDTITADATYLPLIITSKMHVIIGNLNDDVSYLSRDLAADILAFHDQSELIDRLIGFMATETFVSLPLDRKLRLVNACFEAYPPLDVLSDRLLPALEGRWLPQWITARLPP